MFSHSQLGNNGRLGNQLFQIASTLGIASANGVKAVFPAWKYEQYFEHPLPHGPQNGYQIKEEGFNYRRISVDASQNYDLWGYFQSEKYFERIAGDIKRQFTFKKSFIDSVWKKIDPPSWGKKNYYVVGISVRRGDYLNNPNYVCLGDAYYKNAISIINQKVPGEKQFVIFSDDIPWCRRAFGDGFIYTDRLDAMEQLCFLTQCDHFITANSTYSWWGAWLGEKPDSIVIAPDKWFGEGLSHLDDSDIIPGRWLKISHTNDNGLWERTELKDVTFTIPVKYDHPDREDNIAAVIAFISSHFDTNIIVMEVGDTPMLSDIGEYAEYYFNRCQSYMHRTSMLNKMAKLANTPIIFNWDTDVLIDPSQILECVKKLRTGTDMCYPYDGHFYRVNRSILDNAANLTGLNGFKKHKPTPHEEKSISYGGAVGFCKRSFIAGGMENEKFISYGPEDYERVERFKKLGYKVERIKGPLYHIDHYTGPDSNITNPFFKANHDLYDRIKSMNRQQLQDEIKTWPWLK